MVAGFLILRRNFNYRHGLTMEARGSVIVRENQTVLLPFLLKKLLQPRNVGRKRLLACNSQIGRGSGRANV